MKIKSLTTIAASAVLLTLLTTASAQAGTIAVVNLPGTNTDAASEITTNKTYVCAFDYGNRNTTIYSVNGVLFTHIDPGNQLVNSLTVPDTNYGGQVVLSSGGSAACKLARTSNTSQGNLAAQADGNMYNLLADLIYVGSAAPTNSWLEQEFDGLTVGHQYSMRVYYRYWGNAHGDRLQNFTFFGEGANQAYAGNPVDEDAGGAHFIEYNFTATATNAFCYMTNLIANGAQMIYAATVEDDTVPFAPFITYQPRAIVAGQPSVFSVSAVGTAPLTYQWFYNTTSNYSGATMITDGNGYSGSMTTNLTTTNNLLDYYFVVVSNNYGSVTSSITQINPVPVIVSQPAATSLTNAVQYTVTAGGLPPLTYQWYYSTNTNYAGATMITDGNGYTGSMTTNLTATTNLADYYFVVVSNSYGSVTSSFSVYNPQPMIVAQPTVTKTGGTVRLNVTAGGWPPLGYQWYLNTVSNYSGATALTDGNGVSGSGTASVTINNVLDYYFVVVTNYYGSVTSQVIQVTVPPSVVSAGEPIWNQSGAQTNVIVSFSDGLDTTTATTAANYMLNNGATVTSAALGASNEVVLATSALSSGTSYTLTVQNVENDYGITMSPSSTNLTVGLYPANLALWIRADTGVTTDANGVNQWNDMSGNGNNLTQTLGAPFEPELATNSYGDTVVRFNAANETFMEASSSPSLAITGNMSVIAVMNFATLDGGTNGEIVSKVSGSIAAPYDYYVIDTNNGARLYRGNGSSYGQFTATNGPSLGVPHTLAVTTSGNNVTHFLDGQPNGTGILNNNFNITSTTDAGQPLSIGIRGDAVNRLTGDISELIISGSAISSYDVSALQQYFAEVHHLPTVNLAPPTIGYTFSGGQLTLSWPANQIGLQLQSNSIGLANSNAWFTVPGSTNTDQVTVTTTGTTNNVFYRLVQPVQ